MRSHPAPRRLALRATVTLAAAGLLLAGCGSEQSSGGSGSAVTVAAGDAKAGPKVTLSKMPYTVSKTETKVLTEGSGAELTKDDIALVDLVVVNGKDGKTVSSTYGKQPAALYLGQETLLKGLASGLLGAKKGSRVEISVPPADAFGSQGNSNLGVGANDTLVFVVDVRGSSRMLKQAEGKAVPPKAGLPTVEWTDGKPARITSPKGTPPTRTVVQPLVEGTGAKVTAGQTVRVTYTGALWATNAVFDSSASHDPGYFEFPVGGGQVIKAWDSGIVGQKVGSRLLLVVPPADGYGAAGSPPKIKGTDTLVFVVDVLAAY